MSTQLFETLESVAGTLDELETPWALIGGLAISSWLEPRFTRDIDIAISVDSDEEAEDFLHSWRSRGFRIDTVIEQDATDRLATVRSHRAGDSPDQVVIDLMFASSGIEPEISRQARSTEIVDGVVIPVARPAHLFALKLLSVDPDERPQDDIDLRQLTELIVDDERDTARRAINLIDERGYNRGKDLEALFDQYLD